MSDVEVDVLSSSPGVYWCVVLLLVMSGILKTEESGEDCKRVLAVDLDDCASSCWSCLYVCERVVALRACIADKQRFSFGIMSG